MNKKFFSIFVLAIMVTGLMFSGCTKANSASYSEVYSHFKTNVASKVYVDDNNVGSYIISKKGSDVYYFEFTLDSANANLRQRVNSAGENNIFNALANNREYGTIIGHASNYFFKKFNDSAMLVYSEDKLKTIPQNLLTTLYNQVDNVTSSISNFASGTRKLITSYNELDPESKSTKFALEDLLNAYKNLIGSVIDMNMTTEQIIDGVLFDYASGSEEVSLLELNRLVDAFELYATKYIYQKYMQFDKNTQLSFLDNNLVSKLNQMLTLNENAKKTGKTSTDLDTYNYLRMVEKNIRNQFEINQSAINQLNGTKPVEGSKNYEHNLAVYNNFMNYEDEMIAYLNLIISMLG